MRLMVSLMAGACCVLLGTANPAAQVTGSTEVMSLTERELLTRIMTTDPSIRALSARVDEVRALQAERTLLPNPSLAISRERVFDTTDTFVVARQELPVSGRRQQLQRAGRLAVEAAGSDLRVRIVDLQADARRAYTALQLSQARETALEEAIGAMRQLIGVLRTREEEGEGSRYDRIRGERALVDLEADHALAAAHRAQAQGLVAAHLGPDVGSTTLYAADVLATLEPLPLLDAALQEATASRGEYRLAQMSASQFDAERVAAARLRIPTPTFTGGIKQSTSVTGRSSGYQVSLDLSVPLFSRGQAAAALATAQKTRADADADRWKARIDAEVRAAHAVLAIHQARLTRYRDSAATIADALARIGRVAYEEGELGILELLDAERQALDARLRAADLAAEARRAAIDLDRAIGRELRP